MRALAACCQVALREAEGDAFVRIMARSVGACGGVRKGGDRARKEEGDKEGEVH